jgi:hypothetical protein
VLSSSSVFHDLVSLESIVVSRVFKCCSDTKCSETRGLWSAQDLVLLVLSSRSTTSHDDDHGILCTIESLHDVSQGGNRDLGRRTRGL